VTSGSDWRDAVPFETPMVLADTSPGDPARCAVCGLDSDPIARDELWVVKHRHPKQHSGFMRFYCAEHVPAPPPPPAAVAPAATKRTAAPRTPRAPKAPRPTPAAERPRAVCPNCFVEVPPTGICGSCGERVVA
jgi:hypothetical protein